MEVCPTLLPEEEAFVEDSLLFENDTGANGVLDTLKGVSEGEEENAVDGAVDVAMLDVVGGGKTEPRVDPCEIGATGVATDGDADAELLLIPPS